MDNVPEEKALVEHPLDRLMPVRLADKLKMAEILCKSGLMPRSLDTREKVFIALQMGHELGVSPMVAVNNISAISGKPVISADLLIAVARRHPDFAGISSDDDGDTCTVTVKRRTGELVEKFIGTFSIEDAARAGLSRKDNYVRYGARMRKHRAAAYAIRDGFPDALAGLYTREEMEGVDRSFDEIKMPSPSASKPDPKRQMIIDEIAEVVKHELISDLERQDARAHIQAAKTYNDLSGVRDIWTMKRDQRIAARADAEKAKADILVEELETIPEKADREIF